MARFERFEDMAVWRKSRLLTREIYILARERGMRRDYSLCDQLCRAAVSIMSNIAEGYERDGKKEFIQMLSCAKGSCGEVRSQLYTVKDLNLIDSEQFEHLYGATVEIAKMLSGLMSYLKSTTYRGRKYKDSAVC